MEIDILKSDQEKEEIVRQIIKQKLVKTVLMKPGMNAWVMDKNWKVKQVVFKNVQIQSALLKEQKGRYSPDPNTKPIKRMRADIAPDSIYILAINKENAIRKFKAIIEKAIKMHKDYATQQAIRAGISKEEIS